MLRVAAFAGGGLEFLGTLSARLLVLCAQRAVVPVIQGCTGWAMSRIPGGSPSRSTAVVCLLQQTQQRRWTRDR